MDATVRLQEIFDKHNIITNYDILCLIPDDCLEWRNFGLKCYKELITIQQSILGVQK